MTVSKRQFLQGAASVGAALMATGPFAATTARAAAQVSVVATTGMIADAVRRIAGDRADVTALMGPGVDPHAYRQTRSDIAAMTRADLVLWNGLYLEAQLEGFLGELAQRKPVIAVAEAAPEEVLIGHDDYPDRNDPHLWMDPNLWSYVVVAVRDALIDAAPDARAQFEANAAAYLDELSALHVYAVASLGTVPGESRVLVTAHDAFNYFGEAYGFEVIGVQGISTESEAGLTRIAELVELLVNRRVKAVFVESSVSDRNIRALIEGAAAQGHRVDIGGSLFSDAMGEPGAYEGTLLGMLDHNTTTITRALGGTAPQLGRLGQLSAS